MRYMRSQQNPLQRLTLIGQVSKKLGKVTGQYTIKSKPIHVKNKVVVKEYSLANKKVNTQLLHKQFEEMSKIQQYHPIKETFMKNDGNSSVFIVVEGYHSFGNLTEVIQQEIDYKICFNISAQVARLHQNSIVHLNLKPQNIQLSKDHKSVKFTDARIPCLRLSSSYTNNWSCYLPPQCQQYFESDRRSDIWSLGIIFLQMFLRRRITINETSIDKLQQLIKQIPNNFLRNLLGGMCCEKDKRFPIGQVLQIIQKIINNQSEDFQPYSFVTIRIPLVCLDKSEEVDLYQPIQTEIIAKKQWSIAFHLYKTDTAFALSIVFERQIFKITKLYTSFPNNIGSLFTTLEELFNSIRAADRQYFDLENDGSFSFQMKILYHQGQSKSQKSPQNIVQEAIQEVTISAQNNVLEIQERDVPHMDEKKEQLFEEIQVQDAIYIDTKDESDEEQEILTAYTKFSVDLPSVRRTLTTIRISVGLRQINIQLISTLYQKLGKQLQKYPEFAILAFKLAKHGYIKLLGKDNDKKMTLLINLGVAYAKVGKYPKAIACFKRSAFIANQLYDQKVAYQAYQNWGSIAIACNDYDVAEKCFLKCLQISEKLHENKQLQMMAIDNLANLYLKHENHQQATLWLERALNIQAHRTIADIGVLTFNLAFSHLHLGNYKQAFEKFKDAFKSNFVPALQEQLQNIFILQISSRKAFIKDLTFNLTLDLKKNLSQQGQQSFQGIISRK